MTKRKRNSQDARIPTTNDLLQLWQSLRNTCKGPKYCKPSEPCEACKTRSKFYEVDIPELESDEIKLKGTELAVLKISDSGRQKVLESVLSDISSRSSKADLEQLTERTGSPEFMSKGALYYLNIYVNKSKTLYSFTKEGECSEPCCIKLPSIKPSGKFKGVRVQAVDERTKAAPYELELQPDVSMDSISESEQLHAKDERNADQYLYNQVCLHHILPDEKLRVLRKVICHLFESSNLNALTDQSLKAYLALSEAIYAYMAKYKTPYSDSTYQCRVRELFTMITWNPGNIFTGPIPRLRKLHPGSNIEGNHVLSEGHTLYKSIWQVHKACDALPKDDNNWHSMSQDRKSAVAQDAAKIMNLWSNVLGSRMHVGSYVWQPDFVFTKTRKINSALYAAISRGVENAEQLVACLKEKNISQEKIKSIKEEFSKVKTKTLETFLSHKLTTDLPQRIRLAFEATLAAGAKNIGQLAGHLWKANVDSIEIKSIQKEFHKVEEETPRSFFQRKMNNPPVGWSLRALEPDTTIKPMQG